MATSSDKARSFADGVRKGWAVWTGTFALFLGGENGLVQVVGWLTNAAAQRLLAAAGQDLAKLNAAAKQPGFKAMPLPRSSADPPWCHGVRIRGPASVIATVNSKWAASEPSAA